MMHTACINRSAACQSGFSSLQYYFPLLLPFSRSISLAGMNLAFSIQTSRGRLMRMQAYATWPSPVHQTRRLQPPGLVCLRGSSRQSSPSPACHATAHIKTLPGLAAMQWTPCNVMECPLSSSLFFSYCRTVETDGKLGSASPLNSSAQQHGIYMLYPLWTSLFNLKHWSI